MNITWKGSLNFDNNRKPITTIVIHWFGVGTLKSANDRFQNASSDVSAHYGISDKTIWQWVQESDVAYHAGNYEVNQRSVGIEHDATTTKNASDETYETSAQLIHEICTRYSIPIDLDHIKPHRDFKATQCPGTLDLNRLVTAAKKYDISNQFEQLVAKATKYDEFVKAGYTTAKQVEEKVAGLIKEREDRDKDNGKLKGINAQLKEDLKKCRETPQSPQTPSTPINDNTGPALDSNASSGILGAIKQFFRDLLA